MIQVDLRLWLHNRDASLNQELWYLVMLNCLENLRNINSLDKLNKGIFVARNKLYVGGSLETTPEIFVYWHIITHYSQFIFWYCSYSTHWSHVNSCNLLRSLTLQFVRTNLNTFKMVRRLAVSKVSYLICLLLSFTTLQVLSET